MLNRPKTLNLEAARVFLRLSEGKGLLGFPEQQDEGLAVVKRGILALSSLLSVGSYLSDKWDASSEHLYSVISGTLREKHAPCVTAL